MPVLDDLTDEQRFETFETFANPAAGKLYEIEHVQPEFTSICPKTGHPDFGTITITYAPSMRCVELKSLKFYLQSFRNHGAYYEEITNKILDDLVLLLRPRRMTVKAQWTPRGGMRSVVTASHWEKEVAHHGE